MIETYILVFMFVLFGISMAWAVDKGFTYCNESLRIESKLNDVKEQLDCITSKAFLKKEKDELNKYLDDLQIIANNLTRLVERAEIANKKNESISALKDYSATIISMLKSIEEL